MTIDNRLWTTFAVIAGLGMAFQVGHFAEHAFQFAVWAFNWSSICGRDQPWMSVWVADLVHLVSTYLLPAMDAKRSMMLGMEVLHLIGNSIFLVSLMALYYCLPSRWVRAAVAVEGFHLCEHLALTLTAIYVGKPIGISTLFGYSRDVFGLENAVGFRVGWHFLMNLWPMPLAMIGMVQGVKRSVGANNDLDAAWDDAHHDWDNDHEGWRFTLDEIERFSPATMGIDPRDPFEVRA